MSAATNPVRSYHIHVRSADPAKDMERIKIAIAAMDLEPGQERSVHVESPTAIDEAITMLKSGK